MDPFDKNHEKILGCTELIELCNTNGDVWFVYVTY